MSTVPTDSVLRRHYEQMQHAGRSSGSPNPAPEPAEPPAAAPASHAAPAPGNGDAGGGGFFGWLKRLFGG